MIGIAPSDPAVLAVISGVAFGLAYVGAWFFFNKWQAKFWIKACIAVGIVIVCRVGLVLLDMSIVNNMSSK